MHTYTVFHKALLKFTKASRPYSDRSMAIGCYAEVGQGHLHTILHTYIHTYIYVHNLLNEGIHSYIHIHIQTYMYK